MSRNDHRDALEHPLVHDYLERLRHEALRLPADQARELYDDIAEHLRVALGEHPTEPQVRDQLDRIGSPTQLVDEAGGAPAGSSGAGRSLAVAAVVLLVLAELLFFWPSLAALVWVVGLVLLALPREWTGRQKLRGYLSLGTGLPVVLATMMMTLTSGGSSSCTVGTRAGTDGTVVETSRTCTETGTGWPWLAIVVGVLLVAYLVGQVLTARQLLSRRLRA